MVIDMNYWNKVIKNIIILVISILVVYLFFKLAIFYIPFLVAFIISLIIEPIIKFIMKKAKLSRRVSSIFVFIIAIALIAGILIWGITTFISETTNLLNNINVYIDMFSNIFTNITNNIDLSKINIPEDVMNIVHESGIEFLSTITELTRGFLLKIIDFITSIPKLGIYVGITLISLYFMCVDKIYMIDQVEHHLPETWVKRIGIHLREIIKLLGGYLKAEFILVGISFAISLIRIVYTIFFKLQHRISTYNSINNSICRCATNIWSRNSNDTLGRIFSIYWRYKISNSNIYIMVHNKYSKTNNRTKNN